MISTVQIDEYIEFGLWSFLVVILTKIEFNVKVLS